MQFFPPPSCDGSIGENLGVVRSLRLHKRTPIDQGESIVPRDGRVESAQSEVGRYAIPTIEREHNRRGRFQVDPGGRVALRDR